MIKENGEDTFTGDDSALVEQHLEALANHFVEETRLVKRVDELQNKHSL